VGGILPSFGGSFSRIGVPGALYTSELIGAILLFIGFLRATTPMKTALTSQNVQAEAAAIA
jgi:hypothetical protein